MDMEGPTCEFDFNLTYYIGIRYVPTKIVPIFQHSLKVQKSLISIWSTHFSKHN